MFNKWPLPSQMLMAAIWAVARVTDGEFVIAGRDGAVLIELVDATFDGVTLLVDLGIERVGPTTGSSSPSAVGELVGRDGDGRFDASPPQVTAVGAGAVSLVGQHPVWSRAGSPGRETGTSIASRTAANCGLSPH